MGSKPFDPKSPGFLYSIIVAALTLFSAAGVSFQQSAEGLASNIVTSLSQGGVYAIFGVVAASIIVPIYNHFRDGGKFNLRDIFSRNVTWVALGNLLLSAVALTGFVLPDGTVQEIFSAVSTKDWMSLVSILALTVGNTLIRFLKQKTQEAAVAPAKK